MEIVYVGLAIGIFCFFDGLNAMNGQTVKNIVLSDNQARFIWREITVGCILAAPCSAIYVIHLANGA